MADEAAWEEIGDGSFVSKTAVQLPCNTYQMVIDGKEVDVTPLLSHEDARSGDLILDHDFVVRLIDESESYTPAQNYIGWYVNGSCSQDIAPPKSGRYFRCRIVDDDMQALSVLAGTAVI